ncbi:NUMOD4 motif-containing HNH endonuclease [Pseudolactococcus raffinolactis]|uniref:NUMOD4 motif-containing HNH endonuclease n=1 Tax=Pseudolactococcus raffinolactis TaxID=1366 RepID=UPI000BB50D29|nr:NUMOD4 motif-containing HNH endonuclease [Lactococcus raffinolactis]ATC61752.1 HNH endonuclease [Lactococcus raffinolactis]
MEVWKDVLGYEGYYQVSNCGRIRTVENRPYMEQQYDLDLYKQHFLSPSKSPNGYRHITFCVNGIKKTKSIHRIVAEAFLPNHSDKPEVNHIDGNKENNHVENLEWCTASDNQRHAFRTGLQFNGRSRKIGLENLETGERLNFNSQKEASLFLGKHDAYIRTKTSKKKFLIPGYRIIEVQT